MRRFNKNQQKHQVLIGLFEIKDYVRPKESHAVIVVAGKF